MRSYGDAIRGALGDAGMQPRILVTIDTTEGTYRFAQEQLLSAGNWYAPRLLGPVEITTDVRGGSQTIPTGRTVTLDLANADGFFSQ
jgi:hypothetical protein